MLSLSMIVRDGGAQLERALTSVQGFVDEMVVVDTGSGDDSAAIAQRCGATVHHIPWPGDFAPARNRALEWVRGDWVLVLDADEWLRPEARGPLRQLMGQPDALLINLLRRETGAKQSPYSNVSRLFRRHPAIHWNRPYHAMVDDSVLALLAHEPHWRILQCTEPALDHDGYRPDVLASGAKASQLRLAMEADLRQRPGDPYACAKLGALEVAEGDRCRGIALLEKGLAHCPAQAHPERYELLLHLAIARASEHPQLAIAHYRQALALPLDARIGLAARLNLAALLLGLGEAEEAAVLAEAATTAAPEVAMGWYNLGLIQRQRGLLPEAIRAYRHALQLDPEHAEAHQNLAVALLLAGDIPGARRGFRSAIALFQSQGRRSEASALRRKAGELVRLEP